MVPSLNRIPSTNPSGFMIYWETVPRTLVGSVARSGAGGGIAGGASGSGGGRGGADCSPDTGGGDAACWAVTGPIIPKLVSEATSRLTALILSVAKFRFVGRFVFIIVT